MSKVDWSKAPEGATHYFFNVVSGHWRDLSGEYWRYFSEKDSCWVDQRSTTSIRLLKYEFMSYEARPNEPDAAMNGKDFPSAGEVLMLRTKRKPDDVFDGWGKAEIIYSSAGALVWRWHGQHREFGREWADVEFKVILTPEQKAAEEREMAINDLVERSLATAKPYHPIRRDQAEAIYDAGYRKQVKP